MSSPAVQLSFTLRTSPNVRTVHLLGSWDNYKSQLPLSVAKDASAKPGSWKGTFRFQGNHALKLGSRYWYYYIVDGYHVSHDPAKEHVTEKTTGRKLNILDVPSGKTKPAAIATAKPELSVKTEAAPQTPRRSVPQGRAPSPSMIHHPKPQKPYASRGLREADYDMSPIDDLEDRFAATGLSERHVASSPSEISDCSESSGTVFSSSSGSPSSTTSDSDCGKCRCNRFGLTRDGRRVMLDCGGKRCGYADSSSECDEESSEEESEEESEDEKEREAELRRRARARLEAERARNGVKTVAAARPEEKSRQAVAERRRR
ncbi:hypothetical protein H2198_009834 [Neophaeococcomyces mojaviensis]|uniref:Uncharacterized protein n=1 Tax=Neophaeococcomyces mojaviensis TaxID=3383035 RepID=A0ACC2ZTE1_9EURO|nr:hypothetical protein H2198_009834 [Knufia sp. JES_112]